MNDLKIDADDFALFGLPRRFEQDRDQIDALGRSLQSQVHPDRFAAQGPSAQRVAMQWSVRVNEAWQRLRDPLKRGSLLCELAGEPVGDARSAPMSVSFLTQQMAWREALDGADDMPTVEALEHQVKAAEADHLARLRRQIDEERAYGDAADTLRALMFLSRFRRDIDRRLEALET